MKFMAQKPPTMKEREILARHIIDVYVKGGTPQISTERYPRKHGFHGFPELERYRDNITGQFVSREGALEILSQQASN
jgi:hypothetical protein|tara:strand:- start:9548 stop:9781 length:234 start_codon:yes stop_codon:yes gene_type:complete